MAHRKHTKPMFDLCLIGQGVDFRRLSKWDVVVGFAAQKRTDL